MDLKRLREDLEGDEGVKYEIYMDHLGYPTFGIGHLIKKTDPEYGLPIGTQVSKKRVQEVFEEDMAVVINDCRILFKNFDNKPEEVKLVLANMMFNIGRTKFSKFIKFKLAIQEHKYSIAGKEMINSLWYQQVTNRAERLRKRLVSVNS